MAAIAKKYGAVGAGESVDQADIELKRLKLAQGTSDIVQEGKGIAVGDFYNAQDGTKLGSTADPAQFIISIWTKFGWNLM